MAEDIIDILVTNYNDNVTLELDPAVTVVNISNLSGLTGIIVPSGTIGRLPYYDTASTFADSNIFTDGTSVGINNATPTFYSTNKGLVVRNGSGNVEMILQHDGNTAASIQGLSISNVKTDAAYIFNRENLPLKLGTNDTSRFIILGNGNILVNLSSDSGYKFDVSGTARISGNTTFSNNVSIGTTTNSEKLTINAGGANTATNFDKKNIVIISGFASGYSVNVIESLLAGYDGSTIYSTDIGYGYDGAGYTMFFSTNDNTSGNPIEAMRITSGQKLLIGTGTDNGAYLLQVNSQIWATNATVATSDVRLKNNIFDLDNSLNLIMLMKPRTFTYRQDMGYNFGENGITTGFIAQELLDVLGSKDYAGSIVKESGNYYGVAYEKLIPILVKSIQELKLELDTLKQ